MIMNSVVGENAFGESGVFFLGLKIHVQTVITAKNPKLARDR
jgi:hypothetical protein